MSRLFSTGDLCALSRSIFLGIQLFALCAATPRMTFAQSTPLNNGANHTGTLAVGGSVAFSFNGSVGDNVVLRVGSTNFVPKIELTMANGTLIGSAPTGSPSGAIRDAVLTNQLASSGAFRVTVSSFYAGNGGPFALRFAQIPGSFQVPVGDDGGTLANGAFKTGELDQGDLDMWSFSANAGDNIQVRVGATNLVPKIDLYGPNGALVGSSPVGAPSGAQRDAVFTNQVSASGTFTVVVSSFYPNNFGGYSVTLARAPGDFVVTPGDDGGALTNGVLNVGTLERGDLDMWSFTANAGDNVQLRVGGTNFVPRIDLYGPNGTRVGSMPVGAPSGAQRDTVLTNLIATSGTFTVVVSSFYADNFGDYSLTLAHSPGAFEVSAGDEGGPLVNGTLNSGTIRLGDLDMWSFEAKAGDNIQLRMGASDMVPRIDLYGPNGALVGSVPTGAPSGALRDASLPVQVSVDGIYTVVVSSFYQNSGDYSLTLARIPGEFVTTPGDEGGPLTNGWTHVGTIELGDLDVWSFTGKAGDQIQLRMGTTTLVPRLDLYGPDGTRVDTVPTGTPSGALRDAVMFDRRLTTNGTYTVVVSSFYAGNSGGYTLTLAQAPGELVISPRDEGGTMTNGFTYFGTNFLGDQDAWTFFGTVGDSNVFRIGTTTFVPWLRLYGPDGNLAKEVFAESGANRTNQMIYVVTNNGTYTLVSSAYYAQSGSYNLKQSRVPPDINMPESVTIDEGTTLNLPITSQDPDVPDKVLTFSLENAPPGVTLTSQGATNAVLSWTTTEADGPSTNEFFVKVTDIVNNTAFTRTNTFTVVINEINVAPSLTVPANLTLSEMTPLPASVLPTATDPDLPKNVLKFSLVDPPAGMQINENSGALSWLPEEGQGPGTYPIKVVVTDESPSAVNAQHLSTTNTFQIVVAEVNTPPAFAIQDQAVNEGEMLRVNIAVTDLDLPANGFSFALIGAPQGMTIDPQTRVISWTPTEEQGPNTNQVSLVVTDDNPSAINSQHISVTNSFSVVVREVNAPPSLSQITERRVDELTMLTVTNSAVDADIPAQVLSYRLVNSPEGAIISSAGVITWTPTELQGPINTTITTIVTDSGTPPLSATNTFVVVVTEVNSAPVMADIAVQSVHFGTLLSVKPSVTDADQPTNTFTFTLEGAPTGMAVDSATGATSWTPLESQVGVYTVTLRVTDNGTPSKSDAKPFQVTVTGAGSRIGVERFSPTSIKLILTGDAGNQYQLQKSADLTGWETIVQLPLKETPTQQIEEFSGAHIFYRLKLVQ